MKLLAQIISIVANPIVLAGPIAYALVLKTSGDPSYALAWSFASITFALVIGGFVFVGMKMGYFSNFDVSVRTQRKPVFIFAGIVMVLYFLLIIFLKGPIILLLALGVLLIGVVIAELINSKVKASMHLAVSTAFSFMYAIFFGGYFWVLPLILPASVAWSRLVLKRHTALEVLVGSAFGLSLVILLLLIVKY